MLRSFARFRIPLDVRLCVHTSPSGTDWLYAQSISRNSKQFSNRTPLQTLVVLAFLMQSEHSKVVDWEGDWGWEEKKMKLIWKLVKDSKRISSEIVISTPRHKRGGMVCTRTLLDDFGRRPQGLGEFSCSRYTHASSLPRHKHRRCLAASLDPGWCIY